MKSEIEKFRAAARKVERLIEEYAKGEVSSTGEPTVARGELFSALDLLDRRADRPEIRGDVAAREEAYETIRSLRIKRHDADETSLQARQSARAKLACELTRQARAESNAQPWLTELRIQRARMS